MVKMKDGLADLLTRTIKKIDEGRKLIQETTQESYENKLALNLERILSSDDPLAELDAFISNFRNHIRAGPATDALKLTHNDYDTRRDKIKTLIYKFYDTHPDEPKTNLRIEGLFGIPGVAKIAGDIMSLARYLISIRGAPGSRIKYHRATQTYDIRPLQDSVYEIADIILDKHGAVIRADVEIMLGAYVNSRSIGRHLMSWAKDRGMNSEVVNFGKRYHSHRAYFKGEKRPELILEKVYVAVKSKREVPHAHIREATGLDNKTILAYTKYLGFQSKGEGNNRMYIRT